MNTWPTYPQQLEQARRLLADKGREALRNPHAMIGMQCGCRSCFTCAAYEVLNGPHMMTVVQKRMARAQRWPL